MPSLAHIDMSALLLRILATLVVVATALALVRVSRGLLSRVFETPQRRYRGARFIGRTVMVLSLGVLVLIWAPVQRDMLAVLTVFATALVIGLKEVFLSMVGWIHIVVRTVYRVGDRIEINGLRGDVVDLTLLTTKLVEVGGWAGGDQSTGRLLTFPNNWLFAHGVRNDTHGFGFVWNEITFTVTKASDWHAAQQILDGLALQMSSSVETQARRALDSMATDVLIQYKVLTPFVYVHVEETGIALTLRYLVEARRRRGSEHALTISFLDALRARDDIELA